MDDKNNDQNNDKIINDHPKAKLQFDVEGLHRMKEFLLKSKEEEPEENSYYEKLIAMTDARITGKISPNEYKMKRDAAYQRRLEATEIFSKALDKIHELFEKVDATEEENDRMVNLCTESRVALCSVLEESDEYLIG